MADSSDVENALVALVANAVYPNGTASDSAMIGPAGPVACRIYRGMPNAPALDSDLLHGAVHVTVFTDATPVRNTTRFPRIWQEVAPAPATLNVSVAGITASFSGTCAAGQLAGIAVDGATFPYAVQARDTPPTVASNLAALLREAGWMVDYAGSSVSVPAARLFGARAVSGGLALQEIRRQEQRFRISLWSGDPATRDAGSRLIDAALAVPDFIALADGSSAWIRFAGVEVTDKSEDAALYRRDLIYTAEYPTTLAATAPALLFGTGGFEADGVFIAGISG